MKKFRGKKRYFRNLRKKVDTFKLELDEESWYDFYHRHLDFYGRGNDSEKVRIEHIKAHIALYKSMLYQLNNFRKPYQCWVSIDLEDAGYDAVFIHSPNPNSENFPFQYDNIDWKNKIPEKLKRLIDTNEFKFGHYKSDNHENYIIQAVNLEFSV